MSQDLSNGFSLIDLIDMNQQIVIFVHANIYYLLKSIITDRFADWKNATCGTHVYIFIKERATSVIASISSLIINFLWILDNSPITEQSKLRFIKLKSNSSALWRITD